jgi:hypothetical protein
MKSIKYNELLQLFIIGKNIDETMFYFDDDEIETEHYIGYLPQYSMPYWAGYCDVENGCEYKTAEELFNAPIYNGRSIKDRWEHLVLVSIEGISIADWLK